ncbi:MAG: PcfB family protein [Angelakisella sp.]
MPEVQEDMAEWAVKWMLKVPKLSAELVVMGIRELMKKLDNKEPVGVQSIEKLMKGSKEELKEVKLADFKNDMKDFKKLAQKYGVGFSVLKSGEEYSVFFRARRAEQMNACVEAYAQRKLTQPKKESINEKLHKAAERTAEIQKERSIVKENRKIEKRLNR